VQILGDVAYILRSIYEYRVTFYKSLTNGNWDWALKSSWGSPFRKGNERPNLANLPGWKATDDTGKSTHRLDPAFWGARVAVSIS
jgi:hypothetical protein